MVTPKPALTKEEALAVMDAYAEEARVEFNSIKANTDSASFEAVQGLIARWWLNWYLRAGHKRLAYILMNKELHALASSEAAANP